MVRIYSLRTGAKVPESLVEIATKEKVRTAMVQAIGGVDHLELAYFNHRTKKYEKHVYDEFLEVAGLLGNIAMKDRKPFIHLHGTFGRKDFSVIGGHLMSATVRPILEVVLTPTTNVALRSFDDESGLNVIYSTSRSAKVSE